MAFFQCIFEIIQIWWLHYVIYCVLPTTIQKFEAMIKKCTDFTKKIASNYTLCSHFFNFLILVYFLSVSNNHPVVADGKVGIVLAQSSWSCPWSELGKKMFQNFLPTSQAEFN